MKKTVLFIIFLNTALLEIHAQVQPIQSVVASSQESQNPAGNMIDNDMNTRWSGEGIGVTAVMDLGSKKNFDQLRFAFHNSNTRWTQFNLEVSDDGTTWSPISSTTYQSTSGTPLSEFENFDIPNQYARYLRYVGQGNQENYWSSIREVQIVNVSSNDDTNTSADIQLPSAPNLSSIGQTDNSINLTWSGAADNVGVVGYRIFVNGSLNTSTGNTTSYALTGLGSDTTYSITVRALDAAGNESIDSNTLSVTTDTSSSGTTGGGTNNSIWTESNSVASYSGNVAIGRSAVPTGYKMAVEGKIRTREVRVDQENWPDYVFEKDYHLTSLEEIQKHIDEKGHLPDVPSAVEVETNGMGLGKMDRLLLKKIEELTLHVLELNKKNFNQDREIKTLKKQLNRYKKDKP